VIEIKPVPKSQGTRDGSSFSLATALHYGKRRSVQKSKKLRWKMNFTTNFKRQAVLVAVGASLFLAMTGKVYSQEIVNTDFATPAISSGSNFNTPAPGAVNTAAANPQAVYTPAAALAIRGTNDMEQLSAATLPRESAPLVAIAIFLIACAIVKKVSDNRRNLRNNNWNKASAPQTKPLTSQKHYVLHG
jgi:hypothetical protein